MRLAERAFVDHYPDARYLRSNEVRAEPIDRALGLCRSSLRAADVVMP